MARYPSGLLIYNAAGSRVAKRSRWLWVEFLTELAQAVLAVFLLSRTRLTTLGARLTFVLLVGMMVAIGSNISYWNWYGFTWEYTLAPSSFSSGIPLRRSGRHLCPQKANLRSALDRVVSSGDTARDPRWLIDLLFLEPRLEHGRRPTSRTDGKALLVTFEHHFFPANPFLHDHDLASVT
jgi:hypothetical protein